MAATLFYLVGYGLTSFAAWGVVIAAEQKRRAAVWSWQDYAGLGRKYPWLGVAMMAAMFSFTGIPLTLGFWGKFYVFQAAMQGGAVGLALIGLLTSLFSAYYYLRVLVVMYMRPGEPGPRRTAGSTWSRWPRRRPWCCWRLFPGTLFNLAAQAVIRMP